MALWGRLQELPRDLLRQCQLIYGEHFPIEVRCALAPWIEDKPWGEMDPDSPAFEMYAPNLVASLLEELQAKANSEDNFVMKLKLLEACSSFKQNYSHNPGALIRVIKNCLATEMRIVQQAENPCHRLAAHMAGPHDPHTEITQQLEKLRRRTQETEEELRRMIQVQESFVIQYQECQKLQAHYQQLSTQPNGQANVELLGKMHTETKAMEQAIRQRVNELRDMRLAFADKQQETSLQLGALQTRVLDDELIKWKRAQQLGGNGTPFDNNLDQIQEWCEALSEIIWQNRQQIKRVEHLAAQVPIGSASSIGERFTALNAQVTNLLSSLVTSTFIIEKQPPQVMKTNTRFTATVRLLVGGKLNVHMTPPQVKVSIISEAQANSLLKSDKVGVGEASGDILNNTGTMEYHQATRQLSVSFRNMQLRKIKRAEKKGTESVMDEKFSLLFQSQFKVGGGELVFQVWTLSLPVVVIVHGNQEPHAWATVTWDNAFAEPRSAQAQRGAPSSVQGRVPFAVPDKVPWPQLGEVLSMKFRSATGRGLSEDNLRYLAGKAFRNAQIQDFTNMLVSWSQFCKEPLPERNFTFWEWFYAIMKVTREHLRALWNDSVVWGFVGRRQAEDMLRQGCNGTFLLRFSDSELGGVTIAWVHEDPTQDTKEVIMIQPFTSRDFTIRSLADRVSDLQQLTFMYPDTPKDQAFGKYYTPVTDTQPAISNGYVKPVLVTQIPGLSGMLNLMDSNPSTPQSFFHPHSPDTAAGVYHDGSSLDQAMHAGLSAPDLDYNLCDMDLAELDVPVDFSSINVSELVTYTTKAN